MQKCGGRILTEEEVHANVLRALAIEEKRDIRRLGRDWEEAKVEPLDNVCSEDGVPLEAMEAIVKKVKTSATNSLSQTEWLAMEAAMPPEERLTHRNLQTWMGVRAKEHGVAAPKEDEEDDDDPEILAILGDVQEGDVEGGDSGDDEEAANVAKKRAKEEERIKQVETMRKAKSERRQVREEKRRAREEERERKRREEEERRKREEEERQRRAAELEEHRRQAVELEKRERENTERLSQLEPIEIEEVPSELSSPRSVAPSEASSIIPSDVSDAGVVVIPSEKSSSLSASVISEAIGPSPRPSATEASPGPVVTPAHPGGEEQGTSTVSAEEPVTSKGKASAKKKVAAKEKAKAKVKAKTKPKEKAEAKAKAKASQRRMAEAAAVEAGAVNRGRKAKAPMKIGAMKIGAAARRRRRSRVKDGGRKRRASLKRAKVN
mmetsp:Transcript_560/g.1030  ORF Transcript_560/g.1030 Transcript_560/m.1030 type:complete len:436 (+) Transcript_560:104-1411(+)